MDLDAELKRCKAEIAKVRDPKRRAVMRKAIRLHQSIMKLQFEFRVLRDPFTQKQVYWSERTATLEHLIEGLESAK